ncbi:hypothetical protein [Corynebacterium vitaeruminis]|uniref:Uncharacterized protein n=1 Tax=Corynebacterium vitaeruminis DSM 20294 TaxID=1224164 RepID=W5Y4X4_9CORY|nr:hypothetical protein [Corynebacterium vitaeruminis]AHI23885.1 hypothetical protein B843_12545 [Corynebacterium vitaeruminis DSM 20294]
MSMPIMITTMGSVFVGFLFFMAAFVSFMYKKSKKLTWGCFAVAVVLITVVPVGLAIYVANNPA